MAGGGFTLVAAPSTATAGWIGGGGPTNLTSVVNRITFATDTATASARGPLSSARYSLAGSGTLNDGWMAGGATSGVGGSRVDRITYTTDTATASVRGPLSITLFSMGATSDSSTYSWIGAGFSGGRISTVNRITYATDTATSTARGPLSSARYSLTGTGTSSYGWFMGGSVQPGIVSTVDRITYATDTATASTRGPLSIVVTISGSVTDSSTYGWNAGGYGGVPASSISTVQRITFATDTDVASVRGPLVATVYNGAGVCNDTYGWFGGGYVNASLASSVTRIIFATDTATSVNRGSLTLARASSGASSGIQ